MSKKDVLLKIEAWVIVVASNAYGEEIWEWDYAEWCTFIEFLNISNLEIVMSA